MGVIEKLRASDFTYAHLEMNLADYEELRWPARGSGRGSFMMADPKIAKELNWAGIDMMSICHNHSFDFGPEGILATKRHCEAAGLVVSGTGADLEQATEPGYFETQKGRVGLVSVSSGNQHFMWANHAKGGLRARPGVNPLRISMKFVVDQSVAESLKKFGDTLGVLRPYEEGGQKAFGITIRGAEQWNDEQHYIESDHFDILTKCNQRDLERNMRAIDEAGTMADMVLVAHHFSLSEGPRGDTPPKFVREFAHAAIDRGADMYIGHGWHRTLGIEIYKGKPIFYGMGNFFAQSEFIRRVPYDGYEAWGHDMDKLTTLHPALHPLHPGLDRPSSTWWSSAIIDLKMENGMLEAIRLFPVEMGRESSKEARQTRRTGSHEPAMTEGRPKLAHGEDAIRILERFKKLSAQYGTEITIKDGVGEIDLKAISDLKATG